MTVYQVKPAAVPAATGPLTTAEIAGILTGLDPAAVRDAGAAHTQLARELSAVASHLAQEAGTLAGHWSGTAATAALAQFQRLHTQAATLAAQAGRTGAALTWLGTQVLPAFRHPADPVQARQFLTQLTADLIRADTSLPSRVGTAAPIGNTSHTHPISNARPASFAPPSVPAAPAAVPLAASAASLVLPAVRTVAPTRRSSRTTTPAANSAFMPGTAGVATPPSPERLRQSWTTEDRNFWGLPDSCVPALIQGT